VRVDDATLWLSESFNRTDNLATSAPHEQARALQADQFQQAPDKAGRNRQKSVEIHFELHGSDQSKIGNSGQS